MIWPHIPRLIQFLIPGILWRVNTSKKIVYLTFDDGPNPDVTPWVLDQLKQHHASATFFCLGKHLQEFPQLAERIQQEGSVLGNHTYSHVRAGKVRDTHYLEEVEHTGQFLKNNLFRPPYGRLNISLWWKLRKKYTLVLWDLMAYDFDASLDTEKMMKTLKSKTDKGSIIVFHDNIKSFNQLKVLLPEYLIWLRQNQFECGVLE